jgi:hypothetical protein
MEPCAPPMPPAFSRSGRIALAALACGAGLFAAPATRMTVSASVVGRTPVVIGYNLGENLPGSNVSAWLRYSETNGARIFFSSAAWPAAPTAWTGGPADEARFRAAVVALRAAGPEPAVRAGHAAAMAATYGGITPETTGACFTLSESHRLGARILAMLGHSTRGLPLDRADGTPDWFSRWTYWRGVYLNAAYLAEHYDVERFQLFNEPNHPNSASLSQADYVRRMQLGSDAIQAAVADVNRRLGRQLRVQVSAPVSAGLLVLRARPERGERDAATGWGELLFRHRHDSFPGGSQANPTLFHTYAFQTYTRDAVRLATELSTLRAQIDSAGGPDVPLIVSEFNVSTAANFLKTGDTLDTPAYFAALGAISTAYVNAGLTELYVFRLTQADNFRGGDIKKNGTHVVDNAGRLKNILRATKAAEVVRLVARGSKGARERLAPPAGLPERLFASAAHDPATGTWHLLLANLGAAVTPDLDLSAWRLPAGCYFQTEEVSAERDGEINARGQLAADGRLPLHLPATSVVLLALDPNGLGRNVAAAIPRPPAVQPAR